ncbi:hypothetical protein EsCd1HHP049_01840 [Escherichia sp. HH154_1D]|nr:hypothetical protein EsCd1HHP049_01840 [Escherichia sp. HH154_1D]
MLIPLTDKYQRCFDDINSLMLSVGNKLLLLKSKYSSIAVLLAFKFAIWLSFKAIFSPWGDSVI